MESGRFWKGDQPNGVANGEGDADPDHKSDSVHHRLRANSSIMQLNKILGELSSLQELSRDDLYSLLATQKGNPG